MFRNAFLGHNLQKAYNSRLAIEYLATGAGNFASASELNTYASSQDTAIPSPRTTIFEALSLQGKLIELERSNPIALKKISKSNGHLCRSLNNSKFRLYLKEGQYTRFLIELLVQSYLDESHIHNLFNTGELTKSEYTTFVNKLLLEENLDIKLSNIIPDTLHTEILMKLFDIYCQYVISDIPGKLTALQVYDLNLFVKKFIDEGQLGKSQRCLEFIIKRQGLDYVLQVGDVKTIKHFLQLRCGALSKYWKITRKTSSATKLKRLGSNSFFCNLSNSYTFLDEKSLLKILDYALQNTSAQLPSNNTLDAPIVYSLGYLGQIHLVDRFLKRKWLLEDAENSNNISPDPSLLIAVLSAYSLKGGNISKGLEVLDKFITKFPRINLDAIFWRRLLQLSFLVWDRKNDRKAQISYACWSIMKQWYTKKNIAIPYDHGMLSQMYDILKVTKNGTAALDILASCFHSFYMKPQHEQKSFDLKLLLMYQKLILKIMGNKGNYHKPLQFIKQWSINETNKKELNDYFAIRRQAYEARQDKIKAKKASIQTKFDDMEEEDMLLGRLW